MPCPPCRRLAVLFAALPAAFMLLGAGGALAAAATALQQVNVRSGPGTGFGIVARLQQGDAVDVTRCEGRFCLVTADAGSGWVSAAYLTRDPVAPAPTLDAPPSAAALPPGAARRGLPSYWGDPTAGWPPLATPDDSRSLRLGADRAPRPLADIPDAGFFAPPDDGEADSLPLADADLPPIEADRPDRFAAIGNPDAPAKACFVDGSGADNLCLREGEQRDGLERLAEGALFLRNPDRLIVTVCTDAPYDDCRTYRQSGPLRLGRAAIASVSVAAPAY